MMNLGIHRRSRAGFTLVEAVVALVVIAAAAAGVLLVFAGPMAASADPMVRTQARAIASSYLDEILLRDYGDVGTCGSANRANFDTIWCYDGLNEAPTNQMGDPVAALDAYTVVTAVSGNTETADITVNVTHTSGRVDYTLESRRANY